jgi:hypothetical protein
VIIVILQNPIWCFSLSYIHDSVASKKCNLPKGDFMTFAQRLVERSIPNDLGEVEPHKSKRIKRAVRSVRSVSVNVHESPLGWLKARALISDRQFDAGEQLRTDYERAALGPRVTMCWDAPPASRTARGAPDPTGATDRHLAAKARFDAAIAAAGQGLADILWRVVCAGESVPVAEKALQWPIRSGRLVLGLALDRLAEHYRMR